jgi:hypothetical protein|tara:strand:- start:811 stop:1275 length:465 start_codon:yes stop_codon:yes gene_type:complete
MKKYTATQTTALAVKTLRDAFKGVKFSGTTKNGCTRISWTDGPSYKQVKELVGHMHGQHFDMINDMNESMDNEFGNSYIFFHREHSKMWLWAGLTKIQDLPYGVYIKQIPGYITATGCELVDNGYGWTVKGGSQNQANWLIEAIAIVMDGDELS